MLRKTSFWSVLFLFFALLAFLLFPRNALAEPPTVIITSYPNTATIMQSFTVSVELSNLEVGGKYFVKSVGEENCYDVETWNETSGNWLNCNSHWDKMPSASASAEGKVSLSLTSRFAETASVGNNQYIVRIRKEVGDDKPYDSVPKTISVSAAPTPTPTSTPVPTETPTPIPPTSTPTPRPPTATPTPKPTKIPTSTPTPFPTGGTLGVGISSSSAELTGEPTPQEEKPKEEKKRGIPIFPIIVIAAGLGFVGVGVFFWWQQRKLSQ